MRVQHLVLLLPCVGCLSQAQVAEEMKAALARTNEGLGMALVAIEPASYAIDPLATLDDGYRHPAGGPCPSNEHDTLDPVRFFAELDYGDGCLPRSGLLPTIVADASTMTFDDGAIEIAYGGVRLALSNPVDGTASGAVRSPDGVAEEIALDADLSVTAGGRALDAAVAVDAVLTPDALSLDGEVRLGDGTVVQLEGVHLPYAEILGECPTPVQGVATVLGGAKDQVVDLAEPGGGDVTVTRGGRVSDPTGLCGFDTWLFSG